MKISPMAAPANTVGQAPVGGGQSGAQTMRSLTMNTNRTPGRAQIEELAGAKLTTLDPNETDAQRVDEATQPLSPQYAALAKQRRALQVKEREIQAREEALKSQPAGQAGGIDRVKFKADPLSVLLDEGVTYDQLTEAIMARQSGFNPEINELKAKLKALEEGVDKKLTDRESQQEAAALAEMQREAQTLATQGDEFELIRVNRAVPKVLDFIKRQYRKTGEVLDVKHAMTIIEDLLVEDGLKLAGINKLQSRFSATQAQPQLRGGMRTLTNRDTASAPMSNRQRALAAFTGTLKR